jgi:hypothetical protein
LADALAKELDGAVDEARAADGYPLRYRVWTP